jgi:hypothetical protein
MLPTWRIWWAPNNASKWQMGFNSVFRGLVGRSTIVHSDCVEESGKIFVCEKLHQWLVSRCFLLRLFALTPHGSLYHFLIYALSLSVYVLWLVFCLLFKYWFFPYWNITFVLRLLPLIATYQFISLNLRPLISGFMPFGWFICGFFFVGISSLFYVHVFR